MLCIETERNFCYIPHTPEGGKYVTVCIETERNFCYIQLIIYPKGGQICYALQIFG